MNIVVINQSKVGTTAVRKAVAGIQRQFQLHVKSVWGVSHSIKLATSAAGADGVLYLQDQADVEGALGYHDENNSGLPYGFVFTELASQLGEEWSVTLSHEAIEMALNPLVDGYSMGRHPVDGHVVFFWREACDPVQDESYDVGGGVRVSNFVTPQYFSRLAEPGARNDYMNQAHNGHTLPSLGLNPGGYVGFFDPQMGQDTTYFPRHDLRAKQRFDLRQAHAKMRRAQRYQANSLK